MEFKIADRVVGHGDDVVQMFDVIAANDVGRHRQAETLVRGDEDVDYRLVIDECAIVLDTTEVAEPVRTCAREVLRAIGVDPDGPIRRDNAGRPSSSRLRRVDRRRRTVDKAQRTASRAVSGVLDRTADVLKKAERTVRREDGDQARQPDDPGGHKGQGAE